MDPRPHVEIRGLGGLNPAITNASVSTSPWIANPRPNFFVTFSKLGVANAL